MKVLEHKSRILNDQLGGHLAALVEAGFLKTYSVERSKEGEGFVKLNNRDVEIVLSIGDIADLPYSLVVPVNTEFDVDLNGSVAAATSVKSMVIRKYFEGDHNSLRRMLQKELRGSIYDDQKDGDRYKIGTTVMVEAKDRSRRFYFVANSHKQNQRRVRADVADFYTVLNCNGLSFLLMGPRRTSLFPF